jgi:4-hydroxy 2-oxovalerate aldolase
VTQATPDSKFILMSDPSLRDGNHAVGHSLTPDQIAAYCRIAEGAGVPIVEVGHGNGIGASSLQLGRAAAPDGALLKAARDNLKRTLLGVHVIPGFATIERDLKPAMDAGVDVFRIASSIIRASRARPPMAC